MSPQIPRLLITPGEPAGIGPELCLELALLPSSAEIIIIADPELLTYYAELLSIKVKVEIWTETDHRIVSQAGVIKVLPVKLKEKVVPGVLSKANAHYVIDTLTIATDMLMQNKADALVTGPVHKAIINQAGISFSGHTEFLEARSNSAQVVMMLACSTLRVALVTTHLALRDIADAIDQQLLTSVLRVLHHDMQHKFHLPNPVIHVCGLNPHAGEEGVLGLEEIEVIEPVIKKLIAEGLNIKGPLPADTALTPSGIKGSDVTLAMYHDQGLPVLKYAGFGESVNITLGLPFIRISVDHGTALDLAGKGTANCGSLKAAVNQAIQMVGTS